MPVGENTTRTGVKRNGAGERGTLTPLDATGQVRQMPESKMAEAAVLGSMILDPVCIGQVVELLNVESFYRVEHQLIYTTLVDLYQNHKSEAIDGWVHGEEVMARSTSTPSAAMESIVGVNPRGLPCAPTESARSVSMSTKTMSGR